MRTVSWTFKCQGYLFKLISYKSGFHRFENWAWANFLLPLSFCCKNGVNNAYSIRLLWRINDDTSKCFIYIAKLGKQIKMPSSIPFFFSTWVLMPNRRLKYKYCLAGLQSSFVVKNHHTVKKTQSWKPEFTVLNFCASC